MEIEMNTNVKYVLIVINLKSRIMKCKLHAADFAEELFINDLNLCLFVCCVCVCMCEVEKENLPH